MTPIDRRRLEHAARTIRDVADWLHGEGILGREADLRSVYKEIWDVILEDDDRRSAEILAAAKSLRSLDKACNFCLGTGVREACDHELRWPCRDCNGTGLQSDDDRQAVACLAAMEPFRVLGSCPAPAPQVDVIDKETA